MMTPSVPDATNGFNDRVIKEFRANDGRVSGSLTGTPILLLHHIGARSGVERVTPLAYTRYGARGYLIVASNGGSPTHPAWYYNLRAHPKTQVEIATETFTACAEQMTGPTRAEVWPRMLAQSPSLRAFDATTAREIPVFRLTRAG